MMVFFKCLVGDKLFCAWCQSDRTTRRHAVNSLARTCGIVEMLGPVLPAGRTSVHRGKAGSRVTGGRTSGIVGMLGPELLVLVPAALWECWAQRVRCKSGHDQPEDWRAPSRGTGFATCNPQELFNTAGVFTCTLALPCGALEVDVARTSKVTCPRLSGTWPDVQR